MALYSDSSAKFRDKSAHVRIAMIQREIVSVKPANRLELSLIEIQITRSGVQNYVPQRNVDMSGRQPNRFG